MTVGVVCFHSLFLIKLFQFCFTTVKKIIWFEHITEIYDITFFPIFYFNRVSSFLIVRSREEDDRGKKLEPLSVSGSVYRLKIGIIF